jgi:hypothetical protein
LAKRIRREKKEKSKTVEMKINLTTDSSPFRLTKLYRDFENIEKGTRNTKEKIMVVTE